MRQVAGERLGRVIHNGNTVHPEGSGRLAVQPDKAFQARVPPGQKAYDVAVFHNSWPSYFAQ